MKNNNRGFTLVEFLTVRAIIAMIMAMSVTAVGPMMTRTRKGALGEEGLQLVEAAKDAFQLEQMKAPNVIESTSTVCFSLEYLNDHQYFEKGYLNDYTGSVLVAYDSSTKKYKYTFWLSNGMYVFDGMSPDAYDYEQAKNGSTASAFCGESSEANFKTKYSDGIVCTSSGGCHVAK